MYISTYKVDFSGIDLYYCHTNTDQYTEIDLVGRIHEGQSLTKPFEFLNVYNVMGVRRMVAILRVCTYVLFDSSLSCTVRLV